MSSADRAVTLLRALVDGGVRDVVLAPGSRSAPLALALHAADAAGDVRLHVRLDERSAGFLALGLSVGSRRPVAVVTTSGTAVGNLLPAVMEAHHSGRRLVVVSADRPAALRGTGANQTTEQQGLYGVFAPCEDLAVDATDEQLRAAALAAAQRPGPSQLNLQLGEPLLPAPHAAWWPGGGPPDVAPPARRRTASSEPLPAGPRTVVVAGDDAGPGPRVLAQRMGWPLLAEPTSGSRAGANAVRTYRLLLGGALGGEVERVLVTGHPTLSRPVTRLLSSADLEVLAVPGPGGVTTDPARVARHLTGLPDAPEGTRPTADDTAWLARWQAADAALSARLDALVDGLPELDPLQVAREVGAATGPGTTLVVGSSNPVRDLDVMLASYPPGEHRLVVGNRGLAGIDGTVSTALGVALGRPPAPDGARRRSVALMGDVTFLHDANGLLLGPDEPRPDLTLVVVNDDGGSIFAGLEQGAPGYARAFERVFATPHHADLQALCAGSGTPYGLVGDVAGLRAALADDRPGLRVVEARAGRTDRRATAVRVAALVED